MKKLESEEKIFVYKVVENAFNSEIEKYHKKPTAEQKIHEEKYLTDNCLFDKTLTLKVGSQVMCIANLDMESGICNGSQGIITEFIKSDSGKEILPVVLFSNGIKKTIEYKNWLSEKFTGFGVAQIPLILSWAVTIHKSQGATLDLVQIDAGNDIFECGQTYVALSRVKTLDGLYLTSFNPNKIKVNMKVKKYYESLD